MSMSLGKLYFAQNLTYYAGIMLDAFAILLCSKLCWHTVIGSSLQSQYILFNYITYVGYNPHAFVYIHT